MKKIIFSLCVVLAAVVFLASCVPGLGVSAAFAGGYAHIEDTMFPVPMADGVVIPYDEFSYEGTTEDGSKENYVVYFYGMGSIFDEESYAEQLRQEGFFEFEAEGDIVRSFAFNHARGASSIVDIYYAAGGTGLIMYILR